MNMNQYSTNAGFDNSEGNYSETDENYVRYENSRPLMPQYHPAHLIPLFLASCLGLVTNTISAMVWLTKVKSKSGAFFLGCLSGVDACFCLGMAVLKFMEMADNFTCKYHIVHSIVFSLAITSRLLTLPVVAHRWVAISRPLTMTRMFALRRQFKVQACLVLSLLPIYGVFFYTGILMCGFLEIYPNWWNVWISYYWIIVFSWNALITTSLLVLNALLLTAACRKKKIVPSPVTGNWQHTLEHRMAVIVLFMSAFSLLDNMIYIVIVLDGINIIHVYSIIIFSILFIISQWAAILNSSINFVLYVCFAKDFKLTLLSMCKSVNIRITGDHTHGQEH